MFCRRGAPHRGNFAVTRRAAAHRAAPAPTSRAPVSYTHLSGDSDISKRQEVGRGLRLCVDQNGTRQDAALLGRDGVHAVNLLTVIASEGYDSFVKSLQLSLIHILMRSVRERGKDDDLAVTSVDGTGDLVRDDLFERGKFGVVLGIDRGDEIQKVAHLSLIHI